jgi:hypothetical protein
MFWFFVILNLVNLSPYIISFIISAQQLSLLQNKLIDGFSTKEILLILVIVVIIKKSLQYLKVILSKHKYLYSYKLSPLDISLNGFLRTISVT